jgi:hypothetical protein
MPLDLTTFDESNPGIGWHYCQATLQRLFRPATNGRLQFFACVPGLIGWRGRPQIRGNNWPNLDLVLQHYLLEFPGGWLNILGGTEGWGWTWHTYSLIEFSELNDDKFCLYWSSLSEVTMNDLANTIPASDNRRILFNGHSLGGATSVVCAYRDFTRPVTKKRSVVTFGSPLPRAEEGMSGRDFAHARVYCNEDPIPFLPQNIVKVPLLAVPFKSWAAGLHRYGLPFRLTPDLECHFTDQHWSRFTALGFLLLTIGAIERRTNIIQQHYVVGYCHRLRQIIAKERIPVDPYWDEVNAYLNITEGFAWNIPGFPQESPPALPPGVTPETDVIDSQEASDAVNRLIGSATTNLLHQTPETPVLKDQSLAAHLAQVSGRDFRDVSIHLSREPIPDPDNVSLGSFTEATFPGYIWVYGPQWRTSVPSPANPVKRFACRAGFHCEAAEKPNLIHAWFVVAHEGEAGNWVLVGFGAFAAPFAMVRKINRVLDVEYTASAP